MPESPASLAETLYRLRTLARLSQEELADLSGISKGQIGNIERAQVDPRSGRAPTPKADTLRKLADALARANGRPNPEKGDQLYLELAQAAGIFPASGTGAPHPLSPRERVQANLARYPRVATAFEALPADMDDDDADEVARHLAWVAELIRRKRE